MPSRKEPILNVPNLLSLSRILIIPVFLLLLLNHKPTSAFIVFLIATSTDFMDGITARILRQETKLGAILDPASDKILMTAVFLILVFPHISVPNSLPVWLTIIVIGRDLYIVTGAFFLFRRIGRKSFPPTLLGKTCTICQMSVLLLVLLLNSLQRPTPSLLWFYILTLVLTILTGIHYTLIGFKWIKDFKRE